MKSLLSALGTAALICIPVLGEEVTFSFRGTVHELDGEFSYFSGQPFEITYSFENTTGDAVPEDPATGAYIGAIRSGTLIIATGRGYYRWTLDREGQENGIEVRNLGPADSYRAGACLARIGDENEIPASFLVELIDGSAAVFGSDGLPSSLKIESFDQARVRLTFIGARKHTYSTIGVLTSGDAPVRNPYAGSGADPGKGLPGR